jgi:acyl-CoA hydrolase
MMKKYQDKLITVDEALALIKDGYKIATSEGVCTPNAFLSNFHKINGKKKDVELWVCRMARSFPFLDIAEPTFHVNEVFMTKPTRTAINPKVSYVPSHLSKVARAILANGAPDIFVLRATRPEPDGKMSMGLSALHSKTLMKESRIVIAEVNKYMPYTFGDTEFTIDDIDYIIECDEPIQEVFPPQPDPRDDIIGKLIADMIKDGDCLQVGIGGIPNAVMRRLRDKKDLGVHTELLGDGIVELAELGVINCSKKAIDNGKIVTSIIDGTRKVYDFVHKNPMVLLKQTSYTNDTAVLAQCDNQISVNAALEIDLTGQCCSESIGSTQFSGTGGQAETAQGAQLAKGGKSFMVMYSTAMVKNAQGERVPTSKIVAQLKPGATVSLQRNDVQYVATEYGLVNLRGLSISQRAEALISIAHPDFREGLRQQAVELGLIR